MVSKVMTVEASADAELGGDQGGTLCQPSSDKTGLLCANINNSKGHVLKIKSWVVK